MDLIEKMELMEEKDEKTLRDKISKQKDKNKENKVHVQIEKAKKVEAGKKEKAEERMNKIVIKGRIQPKHDMITIVKKHAEKEDKNNEDDENENFFNKVNENDD